MTVTRSFCFLAVTIAIAGVERSVALAQNSADSSSNTYWRGDEDVLRRQVSVPLDQLVRPLTLSELVRVSADAEASASAVSPAPIQPAPTPQTVAETPLANSNNPATVNPAASSPEDPFADDPQTSPQGTVPSGRLMGMIGRAVMKSVPIPSLENLRERIPALPLPGVAGASSSAETDSPANADAADDPFSESAPAPGEAEVDKESTAPSDDPFGGF